MEIVLATHNRHKAEELRALLDGLAVTLSTAADYPAVVVPPETGATYREHAVAKAVAVARATRRWALGDDSGLEVEALGGQPGIRSARYAGEEATDEANRRRLLAELLAVPAERRRARFVCVLALAPPPGNMATEPWVVEGACEGVIATEPRGTGGFGYDPLFLVPDLGRTFAELTPAEKHRLSHRGRAVAGLVARLVKDRGVAQHGSAPALGAGGRWFESTRPDQAS